jgi:hypothetical protein
MMNELNGKLTLDRPMAYEIRVPGVLDENMTEWGCEISIEVKNEDNNSCISLLKGTFDQAALLGLLRRLYSQGSPLISVTCVEDNRSTVE